MSILKKIFGNSAAERRETCDLPEVSPDVEVRLIKDGLERKFGHAFQAKVKVDGYLDEMEYRLVLNDYATRKTGDSHVVWGASTKDVLGLNAAFAAGYWDTIARAQYRLSNEFNELNEFEKKRYREYIDDAVAGSREELLMRAVVEGKI